MIDPQAILSVRIFSQVLAFVMVAMIALTAQPQTQVMEEPGVIEDAQLGMRASWRREETRLRFLRDNETVVIDVASPFGIDRATIRRCRTPGQQLFAFACTSRALSRSESATARSRSSGRYPVPTNRRCAWRLRHGAEEESLSESSPYFTPVRVAGGDDAKSPENRYFEVILPSKLFDGNPSSLTLHWIDFYR